MKIAGSNILVTGGCGLVGSTTIDLLLRDYSPARITILDDLSRGTESNVADALEDARVELIRGDIRDIDVVKRNTDGMDAVIHMATLRITACAEEPRAALEVMCDGSFNVLEAAHLAGVKKVVTASSASIYGLADVFPTLENHHPYNNRTLYGATKIFLYSLSCALQWELRDSNIHVCCVCPSGVLTNDTIRRRIQAAGFWSRMAALEPEDVARRTFRGLERKKRVVIPGVVNKMTYVLSRMFPKSWSMRLAEIRFKREPEPAKPKSKAPSPVPDSKI